MSEPEVLAQGKHSGEVLASRLGQSIATPGRIHGQSVPEREREAVEVDCGAFGWLRGTRERAIMLQLRKKDGSVTAVGYAWLELAEYDPSGGIKLVVGGRSIRLRGRNLNAEIRSSVRLFDGIVCQRVPWIREADQSASLQAAEGETVIEGITF